jgi:hypothetical protein
MTNRLPQQKFCGFMVVRKPEETYELPEGGGLAYPLQKVDSIFYGGVDRLPWFDVIGNNYQQDCPRYIKDIFEVVKQNNMDGTGITTWPYIGDVSKLLSYSNQDRERNEIIALFSDKIREEKEIEQFIPSNIELTFLGFDLFALAAWSLISAGFFIRPTHFSRWRKSINDNGLFSSPIDMEAYVDHYNHLSEDDIVEPLPAILPIEWIEIHRVTPVR